MSVTARLQPTESRLHALKLGLLNLAGVALLTILPAGNLPDYRPGEIPADTEPLEAPKTMLERVAR